MTIKQKFILCGIACGVIGIDVIIGIFSRHPHDILSYWYAIMTTAFGSYAVGAFEHKWKRDKEMAHIVAERLLGKTHDIHTSDSQAASGQYANAWGSSQQAGTSLQSNHFSSMLGNVGKVSVHGNNTFKGTN